VGRVLADGAYRTAISNAHGSESEKISTDGLKAYGESIPLTFKLKPQHVAKSGIKKPRANNNRIERLNGTTRERVKVQRGWKTMKTQIAEGQRIQYNFEATHGLGRTDTRAGRGSRNRRPKQVDGTP
jgi:hypothetical protein